MTDSKIKKLNILDSEIVMILFSCSTVIDDNGDVTDSNQIAQKLSNQLNISVYGSTKPVSAFNSIMRVQPWTLREVKP